MLRKQTMKDIFQATEEEAVKLKNKVELLEELAEEGFISKDLLIHKLKIWLQEDESYLKDFIKIYALMPIDKTVIRLINQITQQLINNGILIK
jgi:thiaminase